MLKLLYDNFAGYSRGRRRVAALLSLGSNGLLGEDNAPKRNRPVVKQDSGSNGTA